MGLLDFSSLPVHLNVLALTVAGAMIWLAGTRLSRYADEISRRTALSQAFIGVLLLGGITSIPEIATTMTASFLGNAPLAVNNLLGGVAMQVTILAVADVAVGRKALTSTDSGSVILLQAALGILLLTLVLSGLVIGEVPVFGVGVWTAAIFTTFLLGIYLIKAYAEDPRWTPVTSSAAESELSEEEASGDRPDGERSAEGEVADTKRGETEQAEDADEGHGNRFEARRKALERLPGRRLVLYTTLAGLVILVGGFFAARAGDAIANQTGLGSSFVGATLVALSTSLPEVSTTVEAIRLRAPQLAFSNIFGTNLFDLGLLFIADIAYRDAPVLAELGAFSQFAAILAIVLTLIYMLGIIERRDVTVLRFGLDSLLVLFVYLGGAYLLFTLR